MGGLKGGKFENRRGLEESLDRVDGVKGGRGSGCCVV